MPIHFFGFGKKKEGAGLSKEGNTAQPSIEKVPTPQERILEATKLLKSLKDVPNPSSEVNELIFELTGGTNSLQQALDRLYLTQTSAEDIRLLKESIARHQAILAEHIKKATLYTPTSQGFADTEEPGNTENILKAEQPQPAEEKRFTEIEPEIASLRDGLALLKKLETLSQDRSTSHAQDGRRRVIASGFTTRLAETLDAHQELLKKRDDLVRLINSQKELYGKKTDAESQGLILKRTTELQKERIEVDLKLISNNGTLDDLTKEIEQSKVLDPNDRSNLFVSDQGKKA